MITVSESSIEYRTEQTFFNNNDFPLKGVFLLPVEPNPKAKATAVYLDGLPAAFQILTPSEFLPILERITKGMRDPSLLGLAGRPVLKVEPVNLAAGRTRNIRARYSVPFSATRNHLEIHLPLEGERYALAPVGELDIRVRFTLDRTVRAVISPTHRISVLREAPHRRLVRVTRRNQRVGGDFRLLGLLSGHSLDLRVFPHREPGKPGTFLVCILPPVSPAKVKLKAKDIVFLLDGSGSMDQRSFQTAKRAITFCLERLNPYDRFDILAIGTDIQWFRDKLTLASAKSVREAMKFVDSVDRGGGTDLYNGLISAFDLFTTRRRPTFLVLAGDGRGTIGVTDPGALVKGVQAHNKTNARIFVLGFGRKAEMAVLDKISQSSRGKALKVSGNEGFDSSVEHFLAGMYNPDLSQLSLEFEDLDTSEIYPNPIPDSFRDDCLLALGKYDSKEDREFNVTLRAREGARPVTVERGFSFPLASSKRPYVPGMWAMRKLAALVEAARLKGANDKLNLKIMRLGREYGFRLGDEVVKADLNDPSSLADLGDIGSVMWTLKTSTDLESVVSPKCRLVRDRVFRRGPEGWVDTRYNKSMGALTLKFLSANYFSVLRQDPEIGAYLALGSRVTFVRGEDAIRVVLPDTKNSSTDSDREQ